MRAASAHEGTALIEIYQNCNIFNDGAWEPLKDSETADDLLIRLHHGQPITFGKDGSKGVFRTADGHLKVGTLTEAGSQGFITHDAHMDDPAFAFALSRLSDPETLTNTPIGVFRDVQRPVYDRDMSTQIDKAINTKGVGDLAALIKGKDFWTVA